MSSEDAKRRRRVVVTGIGAVSAYGWSAAELARGLAAGTTGVTRPEVFDTSGQRTHVAAEVTGRPARPIAGWRRLSRADRFAVAAAIEACEQAGVEPGSDGLAVLFGSSTAAMLEAEESFPGLTGRRTGTPSLRPMASHQLNGPGDAVARALGATGPVHTVSSACASGALAIGEALRLLRSGQADVAIAGGADSLCRLTYAGFNALRAVDERPCRPFRADREGLSLGEGAGVVVLEPLERALARGARPLAEVLGSGASCDSHHMTAPHPEGAGAVLAIRRALADARIDPGAVSFVNAHGTGTPLNDAAESRALADVFRAAAGRLPTTSTKAALGHLLGTSGAIEAVATVLGLVAGVVHATAGEGEADPALGVDLVHDQARPLESPAVGLSTSFAFGGANAALIVAGWEPRVVEGAAA